MSLYIPEEENKRIVEFTCLNTHAIHSFRIKDVDYLIVVDGDFRIAVSFNDAVISVSEEDYNKVKKVL